MGHEDLQHIRRIAEEVVRQSPAPQQSIDINLNITVSQSDEVPTWAKKLMEQMGQVQKDENSMKQSTQDLVTAFGTLTDRITDLEGLSDQLKAAQDDGTDEAAIKSLVDQVIAKTGEITDHLPKVAAAAAASVAAPAETAPAELTQ